MTSALDEKGLALASTFCIVLYVTQKFIGVPIASFLLRRTAREFRDDPNLVAQYSEQQQENGGVQKRGLLQLPQSYADVYKRQLLSLYKDHEYRRGVGIKQQSSLRRSGQRRRVT